MRFAAFSAEYTRCSPFWRMSGAQVENFDSFLFLIRQRLTRIDYDLPRQLNPFLTLYPNNHQN